VPSILPPDTDKQAKDALSVLSELAPPCEYVDHEWVRSREPATWVVIYDLRRMCPCPAPEVKLFCDPCWQWRNGLGQTTCYTCDRVYGYMETILRVERL
jgi:hypothetical protein